MTNKKVWIVFYDDIYGPFCTDHEIVDGVFDSEEKAKQSVEESMKEFRKEYPHLKERFPYRYIEWDVE